MNDQVRYLVKANCFVNNSYVQFHRGVETYVWAQDGLASHALVLAPETPVVNAQAKAAVVKKVANLVTRPAQSEDGEKNPEGSETDLPKLNLAGGEKGSDNG